MTMAEVAARNLATFINGASFKHEIDREAALSCVETLRAEAAEKERDDYKRKWEQACAMGQLQAEAAERLAGARVKALDGDTEQKLREALRFSASRSVISSADERRILSAIAETAGEAGGSANLPGDDVDAAYQAALDNLPAEFRGEIGRGELDHMVRAIVKAHDSQWERRAKAMAHHHQSALQASIDASKPAAPEGRQEPVAWTESRLREEAKKRGWYVREGTSVPDVMTGGWKHPFSVTAESRDLIELLQRATQPDASAISEALPATGPYVDRLIRIFRDRPADDASAVVLQDYARAALAGAKQ